MAVTHIHSIKTTLGKAIKYILNPDKTENGVYINSYGCSTDFQKATEEFLSVRSFGSGKGTVLAQHIYQSFQGHEVTPEQAIQIGEELAERLLKGKFQYIIATHTNTDNIHNHIIFNNVSFESFLTFETMENSNGKSSWKNLREISDELCREHNISVIENPKESGRCYFEWQQDIQGKSWKSKLRVMIDETIMESDNFEDFLDRIRKKNIECVYTPENKIKIKFRMQGQERFARGKTLGWYYDEPQIRRRIEQYRFLQTGVSQNAVKTKIIDTSSDVFQTSKGLLHWAEIQNMKETSKIINFLSVNNIRSETELESKATATYNERMMTVMSLNKMQQEIDSLSDTIRLLRAYKKYKPVYDGYKNSNKSKRYFKEHQVDIEKYEGIVRQMNNMYPNKKIPNLENLESQKRSLIQQRSEMNDTYKRIVAELKEIEFAQTTINDYIKNMNRSQKRKQELE